MPNAGYRPLSRLPLVDAPSGNMTAVIETPKGSPNKYDYDDGCAAFRLSAVMPEGTAFPYDFGFFPSTVGEDGDPLDVLVFLDAPVAVGCVLTVRLIGVLEAKQRKKGEDWIRNDRLLAVATHAHTHEHILKIDDLRPISLMKSRRSSAITTSSMGRNSSRLVRAVQRKRKSFSVGARRPFRRSRAPTTASLFNGATFTCRLWKPG